MTKFIDLTGKRYGELVCLRHISAGKEGRRRSSWVCLCDCGRESVVFASGLTLGKVKSCGCKTLEKLKGMSEANVTHGMSKSPEFRAWTNIKRRCTKVNNPNYKDYGGRGITMAPCWLNSFENFYAYVGNRPTPQHSIERIKNDGNYEPGNVKWATISEQSRNKRSTRYVEYLGSKILFLDFCDLVHIHPIIARRQLYVDNWSVEKVLEIHKEKMFKNAAIINDS